MFKLRCKRHYRNLATYSWCTTWREHVTKTAPARRWHSVGGGGAPISYDRRRRRRQQNVGGGAQLCPKYLDLHAVLEFWNKQHYACSLQFAWKGLATSAEDEGLILHMQKVPPVVTQLSVKFPAGLPTPVWNAGLPVRCGRLAAHKMTFNFFMIVESRVPPTSHEHFCAQHFCCITVSCNWFFRCARVCCYRTWRSSGKIVRWFSTQVSLTC